MPLRLPLTLFLQAVRDRLIDDVAEAAKRHPYGRPISRLRGGFVLGSVPFSSEWGSGWENHARSRPLIFCHLQVQLSSSVHTHSSARLVIHPIMRPTYYLPLRSPLPLPAGTPVLLLPHGVPAYYLSTYGGPATALTAQFEEALVGLGAGNWKRSLNPRTTGSAARQDPVTYIVVWLAVQNKQGEDKGMPVIWPATLCVSYLPSSPSAHARTTLPYIPELPTQLQASPPPPAATVPAPLSFAMPATPSVEMPASATASSPQVPLPPTDRLPSSIQRRPSLLRSSPTSDSLRAFRTLSLSRKPFVRDVKKVASQVGIYVDSVVKERERERERLRRERQEQENAANVRVKAGSIPPPAVQSPAPTVLKPALPAIKTEELTQTVAAVLPPAPPDATVEEEAIASDGSEHSGDSLFSPPDAAIDLPSSEEETQPGPEQPSEDVLMAPVEMPAAPDNPAPVVADPSVPEFDPFSGFESGWVTQPSGYMDMNVDYDMGFNMNIDPIGAGRAGVAGAGSFDTDDGFAMFTEDDFDFFDAPSTQRNPPPSALPPVVVPNTGVTSVSAPTVLGLAPLVATDSPLSGPGPPTAQIAHPSLWTAHLGEPFTPRNNTDTHGVPDGIVPPELLPPSPSRTPSSHSAPATPSVHLADHDKPPSSSKPCHSALGPNIFDPIPFAPSHREADGKYAIGKFALPSPPADQDRVEPLIFNAGRSTPLEGWRFHYRAVTDPKIGVIRHLIGVKRKSVDQGARERRRPIWESYREPEEWQSSSPPTATADASSDESDDEPWAEEDDVVAAAPRPSTPPPSYLPPGPTLIQTHFHHAHLLPMCTPLRPPGMAVSSTPGSAAPISVPTPVSPAAILGAASEKSKSLEAAAQILVKEVVENPVWSEEWRANASLSATPPVLPARVWQADARYINQFIGGQPQVAVTDLQALFGGGKWTCA